MSNVLDLAAYRAPKAMPAAPPVIVPFKPSLYPDSDCHRLGGLLAAMADAVRDGRLTDAQVEGALRGFSASAFAASETARTFETFIRQHERACAAKRARRAKPAQRFS